VPLIYCGIDEAGYGPLLGPLCVGCTMFRIDDWTEGDPAPDLWRRLSAAVCREASDKRHRIAVNDSKKLKLANSSVRRHPLHHIERGVLSFLACTGPDGDLAPCPGSDQEFFQSIGAGGLAQPWYKAASEAAFPCGSSPDEIGIAANTLRRALAGAGVGVIGLRGEAVCETTFNELVDAAGTKAAVTEAVLVRFLAEVWDRLVVTPPTEPTGVRVVCDRQGGRTQYAGMLRRTFPEAQVAIIGETADHSAYDVHDPQRGRSMRVSFKVEAEAAHLPVALASMLAKMMRELYMARFNRYWSRRIPELKPTAGYAFDARRWLNEAGSRLSDAERRVLVRRA
jgi:ribonuclease HII